MHFQQFDIDLLNVPDWLSQVAPTLRHDLQNLSNACIWQQLDLSGKAVNLVFIEEVLLLLFSLLFWRML